MSGRGRDKTEPLLAGEQDGGNRTCRYIRYCGVLTCLVFLVILTACWIIQGCIYAYATHGCNPAVLEGYQYPSGDGSEKKQIGGNSSNILPRDQLLRYHYGWPHDSFDVTRRHGEGGLGKVGTWYRYGGPLFTTYVFIDTPSNISTVYMRRNLLKLGMSHRIARCDGKGPYIKYYEGSNYFLNRLRRNILFRWLLDKDTETVFKISVDGEHVADALQSVTSSLPTINFAKTDHKSTFASGAQEASSSQWMIQNDFEFDTIHESQPLPYWATSGCTVLFAFNKHHREATDEEAKEEDAEEEENSRFLQKPAAPLVAALVDHRLGAAAGAEADPDQQRPEAPSSAVAEAAERPVPADAAATVEAVVAGNMAEAKASAGEPAEPMGQKPPAAVLPAEVKARDLPEAAETPHFT